MFIIIIYEISYEKGIDKLKSEHQAKCLFWNNIKSKQTKALLRRVCFGLIDANIGSE
jgi:hypothetical protein